MPPTSLQQAQELYSLLQKQVNLNRLVDFCAVVKPDEFAIIILKEAFEMLSESNGLSFVQKVSQGNISSDKTLKSNLQNMNLESREDIVRMYDSGSAVKLRETTLKLTGDEHNKLSNINKIDGILRVDYTDLNGFSRKGMVIVENDAFAKIPNNFDANETVTKDLTQETITHLHHLQTKALQGVALARSEDDGTQPTYSVRINTFHVDSKQLNTYMNSASGITLFDAIQKNDASQHDTLYKQKETLRALYAVLILFNELLWIAILIACNMHERSFITNKVVNIFSAQVDEKATYDNFFFVNFPSFNISSLQMDLTTANNTNAYISQFTRRLDESLLKNSEWLKQCNAEVCSIGITRDVLPTTLVLLRRVDIKAVLQLLRRNTTTTPNNTAPVNILVMTRGMWYPPDIRDLLNSFHDHSSTGTNTNNYAAFLGRYPQYSVIGLNNGYVALDLEGYYETFATNAQTTPLHFDINKSLTMIFAGYESKPNQYSYYAQANLQVLSRISNFFENSFWRIHKHLVYAPPGWESMGDIIEPLQALMRKKELALVQRDSYILNVTTDDEYEEVRTQPKNNYFDRDFIPRGVDTLKVQLIRSMCEQNPPLEQDMLDFLYRYNIPYSAAFFRMIGCTNPITLNELAKQHIAKPNQQILDLMRHFPISTQTELQNLMVLVQRDLSIFLNMQRLNANPKKHEIKITVNELLHPYIVDSLREVYPELSNVDIDFYALTWILLMLANVVNKHIKRIETQLTENELILDNNINAQIDEFIKNVHLVLQPISANLVVKDSLTFRLQHKTRLLKIFFKICVRKFLTLLLENVLTQAQYRAIRPGPSRLQQEITDSELMLYKMCYCCRKNLDISSLWQKYNAAEIQDQVDLENSKYAYSEYNRNWVVQWHKNKQCQYESIDGAFFEQLLNKNLTIIREKNNTSDTATEKMESEKIDRLQIAWYKTCIPTMLYSEWVEISSDADEGNVHFINEVDENSNKDLLGLFPMRVNETEEILQTRISNNPAFRLLSTNPKRYIINADSIPTSTILQMFKKFRYDVLRLRCINGEIYECTSHKIEQKMCWRKSIFSSYKESKITVSKPVEEDMCTKLKHKSTRQTVAPSTRNENKKYDDKALTHTAYKQKHLKTRNINEWVQQDVDHFVYLLAQCIVNTERENVTVALEAIKAILRWRRLASALSLLRQLRETTRTTDVHDSNVSYYDVLQQFAKETQLSNDMLMASQNEKDFDGYNQTRPNKIIIFQGLKEGAQIIPVVFFKQLQQTLFT